MATREQTVDGIVAMLDALDTFIEAATVARKERIRRPIEKRLEPKLAALFAEQGKVFLRGFAKLESKLPKEDFTEAAKPKLDWETFYTASADAIEADFIAAIVEAAGESTQASADLLISDLKLDVSFDLKNPRAVAYLKSRGAANVTAISETTRDYLKTIITEGVEQGWSYGRLAARIRERFAEFSDGTPITASRARLIAVTETGTAYEAGSRVVIDDLTDAGLEMEKSWLTVNDGKVSDGCAENEAQGWISVDEAHASGDQNPLRFPGCRCTELYRRKGSE